MESNKPKVGEVIEGTIEGVATKGDGVLKHDGFVIFVPNAYKGQDVKVRVTKICTKVGFGELI